MTTPSRSALPPAGESDPLVPDPRSIRKRRVLWAVIGVRPLAAVFCAFSAPWYLAVCMEIVSAGKDVLPAGSGDLFLILFMLTPFLNPLLAATLVRAYTAEGRTHPWAFWLSFIFVAAPSVIFVATVTFLG